MKFVTPKEVRAAVKAHLEAEDYQDAALVILQNREFMSHWWITWAERVRAGQIVPEMPKVDVPLLRDGDLFGEPITNGVKLKRDTVRRKHVGNHQI